jgi:uncharacterized membrane protein YuzA (DUF378 family)
LFLIRNSYKELNWLLVGLLQFDLVAAIFGGEVGQKATFSRIIYVIVGLSAAKKVGTEQITQSKNPLHAGGLNLL